MPYDVKLPDIGEGVAEGEIVRWLVKPGEVVREDQPLVGVMRRGARLVKGRRRFIRQESRRVIIRCDRRFYLL